MHAISVHLRFCSRKWIIAAQPLITVERHAHSSKTHPAACPTKCTGNLPHPPRLVWEIFKIARRRRREKGPPSFLGSLRDGRIFPLFLEGGTPHGSSPQLFDPMDPFLKWPVLLNLARANNTREGDGRNPDQPTISIRRDGPSGPNVSAPSSPNDTMALTPHRQKWCIRCVHCR